MWLKQQADDRHRLVVVSYNMLRDKRESKSLLGVSYLPWARPNWRAAVDGGFHELITNHLLSVGYRI